MDTALKLLETKLTALVLRLKENEQHGEVLAVQLAAALQENMGLKNCLEEMKKKMVALIERLPVDEEDSVL